MVPPSAILARVGLSGQSSSLAIDFSVAKEMEDRMPDELKPKDHAEAVALFRAQVIGPVAARRLGHGELAEELRRLTQKHFHPPWASRSRTYSFRSQTSEETPWLKL